MAWFKRRFKPVEMTEDEYSDKTKLEKGDIPAMLIAAFQVLMPVVLGVWALFALVIFIILKVWN